MMKNLNKSIKLMGLTLTLLSVGSWADDASKNFQKICLECHANNGMGKARTNPKTGQPMINAMMGPRIAGLKETYISEQVKAVKAGVRKNANTVSMKQKISKLTDADIDALAKYISKDLNPSAGAHTGMQEGAAK